MKRGRHNLDLEERLASRCKSSFLAESEVEESSQNLEFRGSDQFEGILNKQTNKLWNAWMSALGVWRLASGLGYCNLGSFWPCSFCTPCLQSLTKRTWLHLPHVSWTWLSLTTFATDHLLLWFLWEMVKSHHLWLWFLPSFLTGLFVSLCSPV